MIGHSEGTTQSFIGLTMKYNYYKEKINLFAALAPVARLYNTPSTFMRIIDSESETIKDYYVDKLHYYNFLAPNVYD